MRIFTFFALLVAGLPAAATGAEAERPNIVVFISDDHGYLDSQVAGNAEVATPNMVRLAERGITFTHAFAASPSCAPSRAAFLTGLMPPRNGAMLNHQPPRADVKKLPAYMHELGYEVVAIGKVAHYQQAGMYGFDHASHDTFHDHEVIPAALEYLAKRDNAKPLCLFVGTNWPHVPWPEATMPQEKIDGLKLPPTHVDTPETRAWRARYYAAVEKMDADLGQIYDAAYDKLGDNTLFIHFSDHGAQWPFGKWNLYDAGSRVPFFAVWPGVIEPHSQCDAMISLVDLLPTLVEAAGGAAPTGIDGQSLLAYLRGSQPATDRDVNFAIHSGDGKMNESPMRSYRTRRWKYIRNLRPEGEYHTHIDRAKAVDGNSYWRSWVKRGKSSEAARAIVDRYLHRPAEELYDLSNDPFEQHNLADDPSRAGELKAAQEALQSWMDAHHDDGLATEEAAMEAFKAR